MLLIQSLQVAELGRRAEQPTSRLGPKIHPWVSEECPMRHARGAGSRGAPRGPAGPPTGDESAGCRAVLRAELESSFKSKPEPQAGAIRKAWRLHVQLR